MIQTAANSAVPIGFRKKIAQDYYGEKRRHAAGVLFVAPDGDVLLLRRSNGEANYAGHWALPGGGGEEGESPEQTATREAGEEMGGEGGGDSALGADLKELDRVETPTGMMFHTFVAPVKEKFVPRLNGEHSGYAWASLNTLPRPLHPGVEKTLKEQVGMADDMQPDDFKGVCDGFLKWTAETESQGATDSALRLALDRDSVRTYTVDGHLKVERTHISKANVCPYRGKEIPNYEQLGLEPDRIYQLLRDPDELAKAAPTLNGVPLLRIHKPVTSTDHPKVDTVGAVGTNAEFDGDYLDNALVIWTQDDIDSVDSNKKRELSAGYRYVADMTPGNFHGKAFDGVMRDIHFNHVALVEDGRAGPDVVVGDSTEHLHMKPTRLAARSLLMTGACMSPILAMDATLPKALFADISSKNFAEKKPLIIAAVKKAVTGKIRRGMAFDETLLSKLLDDVGADDKDEVDKPVSEKQHEALEAAAKGSEELGIPKASGGEEFVDHDTGKKKPAYDAEAVKEWLRGKGMGEDAIADFDKTFPPPAADEDEEAKKKREAEEAEKKAKGAEDMKDVVTKPAMDAALKTHGDAVEKRVIARERGIRAALATVKEWTGEIAPSAAMAFDSAEDVYRHALTTLGVDGAKELHAEALLPVLKAQPKPGARPSVIGDGIKLGMDEAARNSMKSIIGIDLDRIGTA